MKRNSLSNPLTRVVFVAVLGLSGAAAAADTTKISGTVTAKNVKEDVLPVSAPEGNLFLLEEFQGTNKNTGKTDFLEGATVDDKAVTALMHGNGPQHGYMTFTIGDDKSEVRWNGSVKTVVTNDGQRQVSFSGKWETVKGAGKYAGIHGHGTYTGHLTSPTEYVLFWRGEY